MSVYTYSALFLLFLALWRLEPQQVVSLARGQTPPPPPPANGTGEHHERGKDRNFFFSFSWNPGYRKCGTEKQRVAVSRFFSDVDVSSG